MQLRFELGDSQAPRGHAILYARAGNDTNRYLATYCVVLPIQFSIGKFLPPILAGQLPVEGLADAAAMSIVPMPPMLEDVPSLAHLRQLAERRGDDLCDLGPVSISDDRQRLVYAAEACQSYGELFAAYSERWPQAIEGSAEGGRGQIPLDDLNVDEVLAEMLPERERIGELARLIGQARYASEVHDARQRTEVERKMRGFATKLPEKYRADQLIESALTEDATGAQLAELYLQRAYKLLDEEYADIPPLERRIRALRGEDPPGEQPPASS
jgi:hypothetical protein